MVGGDAERDNKFVDKQVKTWFSPWTRLVGRMEDTVDFSKFPDINGLIGLLEFFSILPECQPYLEKEFKGFAVNLCEDWGLNYLELPEKFRDPARERTFIKNHPEFTPAKTARRSGPKQ